MEVIISTALPVILVAIPVAVFLTTGFFWQRRVAKRNRRSPLTQDLLRAPGETLRKEIEVLQSDALQTTLTLFVTPLFLFSSYISLLHFGGKRFEVMTPAILVIFAAVVLSALIRKVFGLFEELRKKRLGLEGELATGEELNQLMLEGCRVFHDVPIQYGNVDHVVVSTSGVFVVETKTLAKANKSNAEQVTVDFPNNRLIFVDRTLRIPNKQLETNAKWLSQHLTSATGMNVKCEPMLALPGYFIAERIGKGNVCVFNPKQPKKFFLNSRDALTPRQVQQIAHQLEQLCRDVEPSFRNTK